MQHDLFDQSPQEKNDKINPDKNAPHEVEESAKSDSPAPALASSSALASLLPNRTSAQTTLISKEHRLFPLAESGICSDTDIALADFMMKSSGGSLLLGSLTALLSAAGRQGHTACDISDLFGSARKIITQKEIDAANLLPENDFITDNELLVWTNSMAVYRPDQKAGSMFAPLVIDGGNVSFRRFYAAEEMVANSLRELSYKRSELNDQEYAKMEQFFGLIFESSENSIPQRMAAAAALHKQLTVVTGGPGTGKTYTVLRILLVLLKLQDIRKKDSPPKIKRSKALRIGIAAPTGKAANRVRDSINSGLQDLRKKGDSLQDDTLKDLISQIPAEAFTIHRLLGTRAKSSLFTHNRENPLPYDVIIIDEASMVDLSMMQKLLNALRPEAKLILLGDKNQLASVESGAVLADICEIPDDVQGSSSSFEMHCKKLGIGENPAEIADIISNLSAKAGQKSSQVESVSGPDYKQLLADATVELRFSHRFKNSPVIGEFSTAVNEGNEQRAIELLESKHPNLVWLDGDIKKTLQSVKEDLQARFSSALNLPAFEADKKSDHVSYEEMLSDMDKFQILCAHKTGKLGIEDINRKVEQLLNIKTTDTAAWYAGRPVLITQNDYQLKLFNGDTGLTVPGTGVADLAEPADSENETEIGIANIPLSVIFNNPDAKTTEDAVRFIPVSQLTRTETSWAVTVHKSQGSEYQTILLILPEDQSPILTRELLYTAVTRAREKVIIAGKSEVVKKAIRQKTVRYSRLSEKLRRT